MRRGPLLHRIKTCRDVLVLRLDRERALVVGCDSTGAIGPKSLDRLRVSGQIVGKFAARVALMEVLCVGANPICIVNTLAVEPRPTGTRIMEGIRDEIRRTRLSPNIPIMCSTEKNIPVSQTGVGVTALATAPCHALKIGRCRPRDLLVAIGSPAVGNEVLLAEKERRIADTRDVLTLLELAYVHEILPVGSQGVLKEAHTIAWDSHLKFKQSRHPKIDVRKSAGPATVVVCALPPSYLGDLSFVVSKPATAIGILR